MNAVLVMPTAKATPEPKKILSARVRLSTHGKIANVIECWRESERLDEQPKEVIDAIDLTHVVDTLLAKALDDELAQWGGYARTEEQKAAQMKALRDSFKPKKQTK